MDFNYELALLLLKITTMNKSFVITAIPSVNLLKIILGDIFMKSEIEHVLHLIRVEKMKLKEGFNVLLDIDNLQLNASDIYTIHHKIQNVLRDNNTQYNYSTSGGSGFFN